MSSYPCLSASGRQRIAPLGMCLARSGSSPAAAGARRAREPVDVRLREILEVERVAELREHERGVLLRVDLAVAREQREAMLLVEPPELAERDGSSMAGKAELGEPARELEGLAL